MSKPSYIVGRHPIIEALQSGQKIDKVLISRKAHGEVIQQIKELCRELDIHYQSVPEEKLHREFRNHNHQGVAAFMSAIDYVELQDMIDYSLDSGEFPFFVILDGVTDVRNVGAIARTAHGLGVHGLIIPNKRSAPIQADAIKASAGALMHLPICKVNNIATAIKDLKLNGIHVIGIHTYTEDYIEEIPGDLPIALVMGAEDKGISRDVQKEIDGFYKIPIQNVESYNVSVATALTMYQIQLNRNKKSFM